jgi:hypothetical protein
VIHAGQVPQENPACQVHPAGQAAAQERQRDQAEAVDLSGQDLPGTGTPQVRPGTAGPMPGLLPRKAALQVRAPDLSRLSRRCLPVQAEMQDPGGYTALEKGLRQHPMTRMPGLSGIWC